MLPLKSDATRMEARLCEDGLMAGPSVRPESKSLSTCFLRSNKHMITAMSKVDKNYDRGTATFHEMKWTSGAIG